ncbi:hypothetical protein CCACVL1_12556 [Corchorus capsularis]|uniref:Uncharacterized protein n=1 Tax=Corchorus capsularis TaxID=210143 RepID=A0A1R3IF19_COCAP|nr:hypothetical protein CCACVL1_12556 [Corchorus capsularis]
MDNIESEPCKIHVTMEALPKAWRQPHDDRRSRGGGAGRQPARGGALCQPTFEQPVD